MIETIGILKKICSVNVQGFVELIKDGRRIEHTYFESKAERNLIMVGWRAKHNTNRHYWKYYFKIELIEDCYDTEEKVRIDVDSIFETLKQV